METVEVKKDIEVICKCSECGEELEISCAANRYGDITCDVDVCECQKYEDEG